MFSYPGPLSTFSARANLCFSLGLISVNEYNNCDVIRAVRNKFAHNSDFSMTFESEAVIAQCKKLSLSKAPEVFELDHDDYRNIFAITSVVLHVQWTERIEYSLKNRPSPFVLPTGSKGIKLDK